MRRLIDKFNSSIINKDNTYSFYKLYNKTQYWSYGQLLQYQVKLLQKLWIHAVNNVPYYQNLEKPSGVGSIDISTIGDLEKLPILTKDIVRDNFDGLKATNLSKDRFGQNSTSGSTGSSFYFFSDSSKYPINRSLEFRRYNWMGVDKFDRELIIWGAHFYVEKSRQRRYAKIKDWLKNNKLISGYNLSDEGIFSIYEKMKTFRPKIIKSYPSILFTICDYFKKQNFNYYPQLILTGGEKLYDFQRKEIEAVFNCPVYDFYGARDVSQIAQNCEIRDGLHVFMENVIVEVVNEKGLPIDEGEGDLIITDLHNYAMPFIRYKIGDRARISKDKKCKCGRNLQIIDEIIGRSFEIIKFPNGNRVGGTFWTLIMKSILGIKEFQVVQETSEKIRIFVVPENHKFSIDFEVLANRIMEYGGSKLDINFIEVTEIPANKAGKFQFVISKLNE